MITNRQSGTRVDEIADGIFRISTPVTVLPGGFTFNQYYGKLVAEVGADAAQAQGRLTTQQQILLEAQNIRDSFSGVSLDEEAARLLEFQRAYEATARVITVLDSLAGEVINLLR